MERAEAAEGAACLQWRKVARKEHKRERQRSRRGRRGRRRKKDQSKEERRGRNGTSRSCRRCCLLAMEEGCQEGTQKREAEKQEG